MLNASCENISEAGSCSGGCQLLLQHHLVAFVEDIKLVGMYRQEGVDALLQVSQWRQRHALQLTAHFRNPSYLGKGEY